MNDIQKEFMNAVKSRKRVFGSPTLLYSDILFLLREQEKEYNKKFKAGDFFISSKEITDKRAKITKKKKIIESVSTYLLKLLNNVNDPLWNNTFLFSNILFDSSHQRPLKLLAPDKTGDDFEIEQNESSVVNMDELNNILKNKPSEVIKEENSIQLSQIADYIYEEQQDDEENEEVPYSEILIDYILQMKGITIALKIHNVNTSPEIPICVFEDCVLDPAGKTLFKLTPKISKDIFIIDVIYNKTGAMIFKNSTWEKASSSVIHISELKSFIESITKDREEIPFKERFIKLSEMYDMTYKPKLTEFSEDVEIMKKDLNLK